MRVLLVFSIAAGILLSAQPALAQSADLDPVTIIGVYTHVNGVAYIKTSQPAETELECAARKDVFTFSTTTDSGRALFSLAVSAYLAGKPVRVRGTGSCDLSPGSNEDLAYLYLH